MSYHAQTNYLTIAILSTLIFPEGCYRLSDWLKLPPLQNLTIWLSTADNMLLDNLLSALVVHLEASERALLAEVAREAARYELDTLRLLRAEDRKVSSCKEVPEFIRELQNESCAISHEMIRTHGQAIARKHGTALHGS